MCAGTCVHPRMGFWKCPCVLVCVLGVYMLCPPATVCVGEGLPVCAGVCLQHAHMSLFRVCTRIRACVRVNVSVHVHVLMCVCVRVWKSR